MGHTDKEKERKAPQTFLDKEKLTVIADLNTADYYRALIWNSIVDITNVENLRCLVNVAMTFSHREREGRFDETREFFEFIASGEAIAQFLSEE